MQGSHPLEGGIAVLRRLIAEQPALEAEYDASRGGFHAREVNAETHPSERLLAERRHLEWFAFERTSPALGDRPAQALYDRWLAAAEPRARVFADALLYSRTGVFEIQSLEPGVGFWVEDLLALGAYPVEEPEASPELEVGDVLAGRLFPVGESQYRLSAAVAVYRNPELAKALRRDLSGLREQRRGVLRISQAEIERMFFAPRVPGESKSGAPVPAAGPAQSAVRVLAGDTTAAPDSTAVPDSTVRTEVEAHPADEPELDAGAMLEGVRTRLTAGGIDPDTADDWLAQLAAAASDDERAGALASTVLERAAFDSEADLDALREELLELRSALAARADELRKKTAERPAQRPGEGASSNGPASNGPSSRGPSSRGRASSDEQLGSPGGDRAQSDAQVAAALAEFDAGRADGRPLEELFGSLEAELGVEGEEEETGGAAPDFPGVVGALVEEFLWERSHQGRELDPARSTGLRELADCTRRVGLVEELDVEHLVDFAARRSIDSGSLGTDYASGELLSALELFARWVEQQQGVLLWSAFQRQHASLEGDLPRVVSANVRLELVQSLPAARSDELHALDRERDGERLGASDADGHFRTLADSDAVAQSVQPGDAARLERSVSGWRALRFYPPQALFIDGD